MRYRSPHAEGGGRGPFALRGSKPARTVIAAAVAGAIGFVPAVLLATPASAAPNTMANVSAVEGQDLVFTLTYNGTGAATYNIVVGDTGSTASGTGSNIDYTAPTATTLTFASTGAPAQTITVKTTDDKLYEPDETVLVTATKQGDPTDTVTATGTIVNNDDPPTYTLSALPNPVDENVAGHQTLVKATLSAPSGMNTTINLSTVNGTAVAGTNFSSTITPIFIAAGDTSATQPVSIVNDLVHDTTPLSFTVNGIGDNVTGKAQSVQIGINDVTPVPKVTIFSGPAATTEGSDAVFSIRSDYASSQPITVNWDAVPTTPVTGDGVATAGDDFTYPSSGRTVTIPAGQTSVNLTIPTTVDGLNELTEDYTIAISNPVNAGLGATTKFMSSITDADVTLPTISVTPTSVTEGDSGKKTQTFTATMSPKSGRTVTVNWATVDDTAWAGYDYVAASGQLVFPAGTTSQTFTVDIIGDKIYEDGNERFDIHLSLPAGDTTSFQTAAHSYITITDDDPIPTATVGDISVKEGDITAPVLVPIKLSNPTSTPVAVTIHDTPVLPASDNPTDDTPGANDFNLVSTSVTIPAGQLTGYGVVLVNGDTMYEPDEVANLNWSATDVGSPAAGVAKFTILNDDKAPNLEVNSVSGHEGDTVAVTGKVTGWSQDPTHLTVTFTGTSVNGKAGATADDFVNPGGSPVTIAAGTAPGVILPIASVKLNSDTKDEPDETILASGIGTSNVGTVTDGVITIKGTGALAPTISVPGNVTGAVTVKVTGKATAGATVDIWGGPWTAAMPALTKIGSAKAGSDGSYSFDRWIGAGYRFKAAVGDQSSAEVKTTVTQAPAFTASSPSKGKLSLALAGNPRGEKQGVVVQVLTGGKWVSTWTGATGSDDFWRKTLAEKSKSSWTLRGYVGGNSSMGLLPGYSAAKTVTIK